jgi:hypothetical protein
LQADQERVKQILKIENTATEDRYLGLATPEGRMSKDKFKTIKERLIHKYNNWVERNMSSGAKDVMIKAVAQAIPTYTMGVFKLPATLCKELMQLTRYFLGGRGMSNTERSTGLHGTHCCSPRIWGMGFRDLKLFNQALLAR